MHKFDVYSIFDTLTAEIYKYPTNITNHIMVKRMYFSNIDIYVLGVIMQPRKASKIDIQLYTSIEKLVLGYLMYTLVTLTCSK